MKQILFIHGGDSFATREAMMEYWKTESVENPFRQDTKRRKWKDDLREVLVGEFAFAAPRMPNHMNAHYDEWSMWFEKFVPFLNNGDILIGYSLGANFLAKYLSENTLPIYLSQLHLVSGCFGEGDFTLSGSLENISVQTEKIYIYHSQDDEIVPVADAAKFKKALPKASMCIFDNRGHFFNEESFPELVANIRHG